MRGFPLWTPWTTRSGTARTVNDQTRGQFFVSPKGQFRMSFDMWPALSLPASENLPRNGSSITRDWVVRGFGVAIRNPALTQARAGYLPGAAACIALLDLVPGVVISRITVGLY